MVREAMIAGTLQPNPIINGMNDLPCNPILCMILSMINAARAIYPESSIMEIQKYRIRILGRKTITLPTPPMIPSTSISFSGPSLIVSLMKLPNKSTNHSIAIIGYSPMVNVPSNIRYINRKKIGNPHILCMKMESNTFVVCCCSKWLSVKVSFNAPLIKPYLASVIADSLSSFNVS